MHNGLEEATGIVTREPFFQDTTWKVEMRIVSSSIPHRVVGTTAMLYLVDHSIEQCGDGWHNQWIAFTNESRHLAGCTDRSHDYHCHHHHCHHCCC
jgi:hypothetical protein